MIWKGAAQRRRESHANLTRISRESHAARVCCSADDWRCSVLLHVLLHTEQSCSTLCFTVSMGTSCYTQMYCYTERTCGALRRREAALRAIFNEYASGDGRIGDAFNDTKLMGFDEWCSFLDHFSLIDSQFTLSEATQCFAWCRMR